MKKFLIRVNGNQYEVEVDEIRDGSVPAPAAAAPSTVPAAPVAMAARSAQAAPVKPEAPAAAPAAVESKPASGGKAGAVKITAPMPGTILNVTANPGDKVKKGQVLLILEAMKMENEIVAPEAGMVATVNVTKGTSVNVGDLLVSLN